MGTYSYVHFFKSMYVQASIKEKQILENSIFPYLWHIFKKFWYMHRDAKAEFSDLHKNEFCWAAQANVFEYLHFWFSK